jgi:hypothetical protein
MEHEMPVLVGIGNIPKEARPAASVVRLKRLDRCNMSGAEAIEPTSFLPPLETLLLVFNRKLGAIDDLTGIENGKFENEVVESRPEIVANLADHDAEDGRDFLKLMEEELRFSQMLGITIPFPGNGVFLFFPESFDPTYKISQVFFCPNRAGDCAI